MSKVVVEEGSSPRKFLNVPLKRHIGTHLRIFLLSPYTVHVQGCKQSMGIDCQSIKMTHGGQTSLPYRIAR